MVVISWHGRALYSAANDLAELQVLLQTAIQAFGISMLA
jgi:hypothetical protein